MPESYLEYARRITQKRYATDEELAMYHPISYGRYEIKMDGRKFRLDPEDENDKLNAREKEEAQRNPPYWDKTTHNLVASAILPDQVDHRSFQTPIKDQLSDRNTCVSFASLANLEAIIYKETGNMLNLSEQYANWLYMRFEGKNQCDDVLRTTLAASYLSQAGVCPENDYPYEDSMTVHMHCDSWPPTLARQNAKYGIGQYALIDNPGPFGPSIANTDYLETLLYKGHDIVFGTRIAWGRANENGVFDIIRDSNGNPIASRGGHAMMIVGYNRSASATIPYFIVKNSWGVVLGVNGYYFLSYDYIRQYAKYGYIVQKVRTDMPTS